MSASTCPGPTEGQLVDVADDQQGGAVGNRLEQGVHQQHVDHRRLVDDQQVAVDGIVPAPRLKPPVMGSTSSSRWMVRASNPDVSVMRRAARPVGAHRRRLVPLAVRMRRMALTMVVLPTPGPPVMTSTFDSRASRMARLWLLASVSPVRRSIHGRALSGSIPRPRQRSRGDGAHPLGDPVLGPVQTCEEDAGRVSDGVGDDAARGELLLDRRADEIARRLQKLRRQGRQLFGRQAAVSVVHGFGQRMADGRREAGSWPPCRCRAASRWRRRSESRCRGMSRASR